MSEIEFRVGYRWSTGKTNPLFNNKQETLITFSVPDEMYPNVTTFPSSYFFDIMRSKGFERSVHTVEQSVYTKKGTDIVVEFSGTDAGRNFSISMYTPGDVDSSSLSDEILRDLKGEFVRKLKLKANQGSSSSASTSSQYSSSNGEGQANPGGRRKSRKVSKRKSRSRKVKKTRKH